METQLDKLIRLKASAIVLAEAWPVISSMGITAIRFLASLMTSTGGASLVAAYNSKDSSLLRDINAGDMQVVIDKASSLEWASSTAEGLSINGFASEGEDAAYETAAANWKMSMLHAMVGEEDPCRSLDHLSESLIAEDTEIMYPELAMDREARMAGEAVVMSLDPRVEKILPWTYADELAYQESINPPIEVNFTDKWGVEHNEKMRTHRLLKEISDLRRRFGCDQKAKRQLKDLAEYDIYDVNGKI